MKRGGISLGDKRGQVTVFIIAAILIVGLAVLIYFLRPGITSTTQFDEKNPNAFIQNCIEKDIKDAINLTSLQGGSLAPENFFTYQGNKIEYLCYTTEFYKTCVVQQSNLKQHIEDEVKKAIEGEVANCFTQLEASYKNSGYTTKLESAPAENITRIELLPKRVVASFNYTLTATKGDTKRYDSFNVILNNNLYELVAISDSIIDSESIVGDSDPGFYMGLYPDLEVQKLNQEDGSTVYILTDTNVNTKFQFASRSVAWPPGISA